MAEPRFQRQVNFDIGADDWPLLEAATKEHGGIRAGILAGLRALAEKRLADADTRSGSALEDSRPDPPAAAENAAETEPGEHQEREGLWWVELDDSATILEDEPQSVRRWAEESTTRSLASDNEGDLVRLETLEVPRDRAAALVGVSSATLAKSVKAGQLTEPRQGYIRLDDLELTTGQAAKWLHVTPDTVRKRIKAGELPGVEKNGQHLVRLLDVFEASAGRPPADDRTPPR